MKNSLILLAFMSIIANVNAQWWKPQHHYYDTVEYVVMYELTFREDTAHLDCYRTENHMLSIGKKRDVSSFRGYGTYRHNMELKKAGDSGLTEELIKTGRIGKVFSDVPSSAIRCSIFKNMTSKNITTIDHIYMQGMYEYEESFNAFNWQITAETDTINNYVCQKAICDFGGRTWEAWFTSELPFSDGPYKFCNLPGLILNVADTENHYSWKFLSIERPSELMMVYEVINDRIQTTKEGFFKLQKRYKVSHTIGDATTNNDFVKKAVEYERAKNNPIERF
ncbi:MAG: GLPGLI family protein [Bacteroidales bacterium]|nr:GLPGLI family protein [Bacteroidales bacterium]